MILVLSNEMPDEERLELIKKMEEIGLRVHESQGERYRLLGLIGNTSTIDRNRLNAIRHIEKIIPVQESYKLANKAFHTKDSTIIDVKGNKIGGENIALIAGPCSVESEEQIVSIAKDIKKSGAKFLRGGAFKPRTSPYSFQGLGSEGLDLLKIAREETGLPIVSEIMSVRYIDEFAENVDIIQVGARNMQNFDLLKELGELKTPILLKRGLSSTIDELLMSAEYIMAGGNENVILCERGIRTFETQTRNTLDLSAIPVLKKHTHLPIIVDPSHAGGMWWLVEPLSKAAVAVGADGLIIEVHNDPENAKCDGQQSIVPERFDTLTKQLRKIAELDNRII
ncbi:MAG: 3-deoxy-7-phosphoheptulonate synthase [Andreesenia angusta]|nr:3-deoxy-7-phosphoheptulonate synthase [Andreesenia angusta]